MNYKKLSQTIEFSGIGLHTGEFSKIVLTPAEHQNINFIVKNEIISSTLSNVIGTTRSTTIGKNNIKVSTIEHLISTLYSLYLTGVDIYIEGHEVPGFDGSAKVFVEKILSTGIIETDVVIEQVKIKDTVKFKINSAQYEVLPSDEFIIICELYTDKSNIVNGQKIKLAVSPEVYTKHIAYAKTFCYLDEVEKLLSTGFGKGGNIGNVIIIDRDKIVNPEILTYKDEFVRHKILDFLGDLALTNLYYSAEFRIINPSHYTNIEFCKKLSELFSIGR